MAAENDIPSDTIDYSSIVNDYDDDSRVEQAVDLINEAINGIIDFVMIPEEEREEQLAREFTGSVVGIASIRRLCCQVLKLRKAKTFSLSLIKLIMRGRAFQEKVVLLRTLEVLIKVVGNGHAVCKLIADYKGFC